MKLVLAEKPSAAQSFTRNFWVPQAHFDARGRQSRPCAKVFAKGENTCTAQKRRPALRGSRDSQRKQRFFFVFFVPFMGQTLTTYLF